MARPGLPGGCASRRGASRALSPLARRCARRRGGRKFAKIVRSTCRRALDPADAERSHRPFVLEPAELALDRATAPVELAAALGLPRDQRVQSRSLHPGCRRPDRLGAGSHDLQDALTGAARPAPRRAEDLDVLRSNLRDALSDAAPKHVKAVLQALIDGIRVDRRDQIDRPCGCPRFALSRVIWSQPKSTRTAWRGFQAGGCRLMERDCESVSRNVDLSRAPISQ